MTSRVVIKQCMVQPSKTDGFRKWTSRTPAQLRTICKVFHCRHATVTLCAMSSPAAVDRESGGASLDTEEDIESLGGHWRAGVGVVQCVSESAEQVLATTGGSIP